MRLAETFRVGYIAAFRAIELWEIFIALSRSYELLRVTFSLNSIFPLPVFSVRIRPEMFWLAEVIEVRSVVSGWVENSVYASGCSSVPME